MSLDQHATDQIAHNLVAARRQAGLSQEEVGFRAGLHRTAVGQLERAERTPRAVTVIRLAGALGIAPADLLDGIAWKPITVNVGGYRVGPTEGGQS